MLMIPLTFALGMAFDFTQSQSRKDQLNGMADVAALAAVTPTEMAVSSAAAQTQAQNLFTGQASTLSGVSNVSVNVVANDVASGASVTRTVTVTYTAQSANAFAGLLGVSTLPVTGSSKATSSTAPNIDFYLMLDTSPSMEIAATTAGINTMVANTHQEVDGAAGCAFGCHQSNTSDLGSFSTNGQQIPCTTSGAYADGTTFTSSSKFPTTGRDNYDLSRCLGVTLRIDLLNNAAQNLMTTAASTAATDHATYRMALLETNSNQANAANDLNLYTLQPLTSNLSLAKTQAATITAMEMYQNNHLTAGDSNGDMDTYLDADLSALNTSSNANYLPNPGSGTNNANDKPQEVLFIVTDGLNDATPTRQYKPIDWNGALCTAIKARNIRIAVLYTTYVPLTAAGGWYQTAVKPALPTGAPTNWPSGQAVSSDPMAMAAQQCASPGLYYQVSTDGDISAALQLLFQEAIATAHLTQ
jgi:hypothetical protein